MYPYRSNTGLYQKNTALNSRENTMPSSMGQQNLQRDKRLLELLNIAKQETKQSIDTYHTLMQNAAFSKDTELLRNAYLDELKHLNQIQEILYTISGEMSSTSPKKENTILKSVDKNPSVAIEKTLMQEMEQTDFFRELLFCIPQTNLRDILFEIITDKQDHCIRLCFLFTKYQ